jgi:hypothetical protein
MYTHLVKTSNQRCFHAAWWPAKDPSVAAQERKWPLVMLESGQCTRVREDNLKPIPKNI